MTSSNEVATDLSKIEALISKKANGAFIYAALGIFGFSAILVCPLAFIYANQALRLIDQHKIGEQFRGTANLARVSAIVIFLFYASIATIIITLALMEGR